MAKKKILIINKSFVLGGIQTSLINMLNVIKNDYDVTLAIFNPHGPLKIKLPEGVKLLKLSPFVQVLGMSVTDCKSYGNLFHRVFKFLVSVWSKLFNNTFPVAFALAFQKNVGDYDIVVSYHHETSKKSTVTGFGEFALKKCSAPVKIAWIHADFIATKLATAKNLRTYEKFDKIISVSKTCMESFKAVYPSLKEKCDYCYNYVPADEVVEKGNAESNVFDKSDESLVLFSAGRLRNEKGFIPALENLLPLWEKGLDFKWYIAGDGVLKEPLLQWIKEHSLEDKVFLLGFKSNPYPYIKEADYLFLPSLHETFSMVVGEAHALGTSVIASDIPIMREVLGKTDFLCENGDFAKCIAKLERKTEISVREQSASDWAKEFERVIGNE